jgi:hypothetical protein
VIAIGGNIALNALIPPQAPTLGGGAPSPTYSLGGTRNSGGPWSVIPWVLGRHRMAPIYLARPYTEVVGSDQYLRVMFLIGLRAGAERGHPHRRDAAGRLRGCRVRAARGAARRPADHAVSRPGVRGAAVDLPGQRRRLAVRRTEADTDEISIDLSFPRGLITYNKAGKKRPITSTVAIEMRKVGDAAWVSVTDLATTEKRQEPFRRGYRWVVPKGQYDVRLQRTDDESSPAPTAPNGRRCAASRSARPTPSASRWRP